MATKELTDGDRVRALLKTQGRNGRWLAKEIGIDETQLSRALNGEEGRALTTEQKITVAKRLDVTVWLLFKDGEK